MLKDKHLDLLSDDLLQILSDAAIQKKLSEIF